MKTMAFKSHAGSAGTLLLVVVLAFASPLLAQDYSLQTGSPTFTSALPVEMGFVNLANGNLQLTIPIASVAQRGRVPFSASEIYDGRIWQVVNTGGALSWQPTNVPNSQGGWRFVTTADPGAVTFMNVHDVCAANNVGWIQYYGFQWTQSDGTRLFFPIHTYKMDPNFPPPPSTCGNPFDTPSASASASDSSGYVMSVTNYNQATILAPDGTQIFPRVEDTNGNFFSSDSNGNVIDTLGRTPVTKSINGNTTTYTVQKSDGGQQSYTVTAETINVATNFGVTGVTEYSGTLTVVQSVGLPDSTQYSFGYDSYGEINSVTLPTGATVTYGYSNFLDSLGGANRWVSSHKSGGGPWNYAPLVVNQCSTPSSSCVQQMTVTKPSGDNAVYSFTIDNGAWTGSVQFYTGAVLPANLEETVTNTWNFSNACQTDGCSGNQNIQVSAETLTLPVPGGSVNRTTQWTYNSIYGMKPTTVQQWNYYTGTLPSNPDIETDISYGVCMRPTSLTVCPGSKPACAAANALSQTTFTYDEAGFLVDSTPATGIINHDDTNYGKGSSQTRCNLTHIQRWAGGPSFLSASSTYDTTGQVVQVKDPNGAITKFSYADNFFTDNGANPPAAFTPSAPTNAYVTQVTAPLVGVSNRYGYYFNTGRGASAVDLNGADGYTHYDSLDRLASQYMPPSANGQRGWMLADYPSSTELDTYTSITSNTASKSCTSCRHQQVNVDNLGRQTSDGLVSDPEGATQVTTSYDLSGRVQSTTNPYRSTSDPTYGLQTLTYDGLDRVTATTHADGSVSKTYYGAAVNAPGGLSTRQCPPAPFVCLPAYPELAVDPSGKKRQLWKDGLGNILEVDEPTGGSSATAGSGSVTVNGTEQSTQVLVTPATSGTGSVQLSGAVQWATVSSASTGGTTNITLNGSEQQFPAGVTPGTGTVTIGGPGEQIIPATYATGSVTINGALLVQAGAPATTTVTMGGYDSTYLVNKGGCDLGCYYQEFPDYGTVSFTVNAGGTVFGPVSANYDGTSTPVSLAAGLFGAFPSNSIVGMSNPGGSSTFTLTTTANSSSANSFTFNGRIASSCEPIGDGTQPGDQMCNLPNWTMTPIQATFSGGRDPVYDTGTCTITVNGHGDGPPWSGSGTTAASIANALAAAIHNDTAAFVDATASGSTVNLIPRNAGVAGNYSLSSSCTYDSSHFAGPSFTTSNSGSALTGGKDEIDDTGTITATVNNHASQVSWGKGDTTNTIASNLAAAINKDTAISGVTANPSGATVTLTSVVKGSIGNYAMTVAGTYDTTHFSNPSFTVSDSGATLTGGWPNPNAVDSGTMTVKVNSNTYNVSWGQTDTPGSIANKLASALGADTAVSPTLSGSTIYLDPKQPGVSYTFSTAYTYDSGDFTHSSFTTSNSISDYGTATITVNGHADSVPWAGHDNPSSVATALVNKINGDSGAAVSATTSNNTVTLTAQNTGVQSNEALLSAAAYDTGHFTAGSFSASSSGSALTGGADAVYKTVYDSGTVTVSINGIQASAPYQQGSTAAGLAVTLANAFNNFPSSPISISVSGSSLAITAVSPGANSNYSLSSSVTSNQTALFSTPSFASSPSGTALTGGADASATSLTTPLATLYSYDPLGNLLQVTQGQQTRTYSYDVLSRVTSKTTPEDGTTYSYYTAADGTLCSGNASLICRRKDARGITTTNTYDQLNRATSVTYDDKTTPAVNYFYDQTSYSGLTIVNGTGRLTGMSDGSGSSAWSYDLLGQISTEQHVISGVTQGKSISYTYNLDGTLASLTYPSGRQVTYSYSNAQRALSATDKGTGVNYASGAQYAPQGNLASFVLGQTATFAGITQSYSYNNRMQLNGQQAASAGGPVLDFNFGFPGSPGNNGQLSSIVNRLDSGRRVSVTYDALHRIATAQTQATSGPNCWGQSFGYDRWANLLSITVTQCSTSALSVTATNNQLTGFSYDLSGNMTGDGVNTFTYDAENRLASAAGVNYVYDGRDLRVKKSNGTIYWRGFQGEAYAESDLSGNISSEYIFFDGLRTARVDTGNTVFYYFTDQLGSTRAVTTSNGTVCYSADFTPYGGEVAIINTCAPKHKFTGYERDSEAGLDYAVYRQYSSRLGRFLQPDPLAGSINNPQSLNRYAYALDDPLNWTDKLGLSPCPAGYHTPTADEAKAIVAAAQSFLGKGITHAQLDCSGMVFQIAKKVSGGGIPIADSATIRSGQIDRYAPDSAPHVGDVVSFATPGHVAIVTGVFANGLISFIGSQSTHGPQPVDLSLPPGPKGTAGGTATYWRARMEQAKYFQICIKDKAKPATPKPADAPVPPPLLDQIPNTSSVLDALMPPPPPPPLPPLPHATVSIIGPWLECPDPSGDGCLPLIQGGGDEGGDGGDGWDDGGGDGDCGASGCDDPGPLLTKMHPARDFIVTAVVFGPLLVS